MTKLYRLSMLCHNYKYRKIPLAIEYYKCCEDYTSYYLELECGILFTSRGVEPLDYHKHIVLSKVMHKLPMVYQVIKEHIYNES